MRPDEEESRILGMQPDEEESRILGMQPDEEESRILGCGPMRKEQGCIEDKKVALAFCSVKSGLCRFFL